MYDMDSFYKKQKKRERWILFSIFLFIVFLIFMIVRGAKDGTYDLPPGCKYVVKPDGKLCLVCPQGVDCH